VPGRRQDADFAQLVADLFAEQEALDRVVSPLTADDWSRNTASPGWTVADQVAHLTFFDRAAATAITDPDRFNAEVDAVRETFSQESIALDDLTLTAYRQMTPQQIHTAWREARAMLAEAAATLDGGERVPWYGPSMSARSFLTARLMEVWAHGADICTAVGAEHESTDRVKHIATLGVLTRGWSYANRGLRPPDAEVKVALTAPSGEVWEYGSADATDSVTGPAEDFCLVVTQRAHVDGTALQVSGPAAREWMEIAQCFAGPATDGPRSG